MNLNYDKYPTNTEDVYRIFANQEMGVNQKFSVAEDAKNNSKELMYTNTYTLKERVGRFFQGLLLTLGSLGFGLFDRRVRNNFAAAFFGEAEKKVLITNNIFDKVIKNVQPDAALEPSMINLTHINSSNAYEYAFKGEQLLNKGYITSAIQVLGTVKNVDPKNAFACGLLGEAVRLSAEEETIPMETIYSTIVIPRNNLGLGSTVSGYEVPISTGVAKEKPLTKDELINRKLQFARIYFNEAIEIEPKNTYAIEHLNLIKK